MDFRCQKYVVFLLACATLWTLSSHTIAQSQPRILLFTKTVGFTHGSIPTAVSAIRSMAQDNGYAVDDSNDASVMTTQNLANYDVVVFVMTTGDILNDSQQAAFENFIQSGNGFVGIHSASDTEYSWPWYGGLVGAYFANHPAIQQATINLEDTTHPSTAGITNPWIRTDEWYNFQNNPRGAVNVLATLDESTYNGGNMGSDHPIAWYHAYDGGRSWYTGGGHTVASYSEPAFLQHIWGGITYAAGQTPIEDADSDGIADASDNCTLVANADQRDADEDGFGNLCDGDLNNDCAVNFVDFAALSEAFQTTEKSADLDGDGVVNFTDVFLFTTLYLMPPGPSALAACPE